MGNMYPNSFMSLWQQDQIQGPVLPGTQTQSTDPGSDLINKGMGIMGDAVLAGTGMSTVAGLTNAAGSLVGEGVSRLFGADKQSQQKAAMNNALWMQEQSLQNDIKYQEAKNLASMTNSLGLTGQAAALDAQRAMDKNGPTADAISNSNAMISQANAGLGGAQSQANLARITNAQQAGGLMNTARSIGAGNPAAASALMAKVGDQMGQNNLQSMQASNDAIQKANAASAAAYGQAASLLDDSRKTNFNTNVAPHLTNVNSNLNSAQTTTSSGMEASSREEGMTINPLENTAMSLQQGATAAQTAGQQLGGSLMGMGAAQYGLAGGNKYGGMNTNRLGLMGFVR